MASKVLARLRNSIEPRHKELAARYVALFQSLSQEEIVKIAERLGISQAEAEEKIYEALKAEAHKLSDGRAD